MIIRISKLDDTFVATFQGDCCNIDGRGATEAEAVGNLVLSLAEAEDSVNATESVDVRVVSA